MYCCYLCANSQHYLSIESCDAHRIRTKSTVNKHNTYTHTHTHTNNTKCTFTKLTNICYRPLLARSTTTTTTTTSIQLKFIHGTHKHNRQKHLFFCSKNVSIHTNTHQPKDAQTSNYANNLFWPMVYRNRWPHLNRVCHQPVQHKMVRMHHLRSALRGR